MTCSVFIGMSVDGFIARQNGSFDFLPPGGGEPQGYDEFIDSVDTIVIGRKTLNTVAKFPQWPYGDKRVIVLSSGALDLAGLRGKVEQMGGPPEQVVAKLVASGSK